MSHAIWSWGERRRLTELDKCVVLCLECHRRHTAVWRRMVAEDRNPCGTYAAYKRGCRCDVCRAANAAYQREAKAA